MQANRASRKIAIDHFQKLHLGSGIDAIIKSPQNVLQTLSLIA